MPLTSLNKLKNKMKHLPRTIAMSRPLQIVSRLNPTGCKLKTNIETSSTLKRSYSIKTSIKQHARKTRHEKKKKQKKKVFFFRGGRPPRRKKKRGGAEKKFFFFFFPPPVFLACCFIE